MTAAALLATAPEAELRFMLVDDAFGPPQLPAEALLEQFSNAYAHAGGDVTALLQDLPNKPATATAIDSVDYAALVNLGASDESINKALVDSGTLPTPNQDKAHTLRKLLEERFGVDRVVTKADLKEAKEVEEGSIVFLDYRLESDIASGQEEAVNHAVDVARRLGESGKRVPFVVLMSEQEVSEKDVAEFCRRAKVVRGSFEFIRKADLVEAWRLAYMMEALKIALPEIRSLRDLLIGLEQRAKVASEAVMADLRAIAISEWAACRAASLDSEGQRFSDYVLWLFTERLAAELEGWKNTAGEYDELDEFLKERGALRVTALSLTTQPRTNALIRAYSRASSIAGDQLRALRAQGLAQLAFGDVFGLETALKTVGAKVFAVVTPECDLFDRPKRDAAGNHIVLMVEGTVRSVDSLQLETTEEADRSRSFLQLASKTEEIVMVEWNPERISTSEHKSFDADPHPSGYKLLGRLRQSFASQLRDDVLRTLSRTGVMIRPPYLAEEGVALHAHGAEKPIQVEGGAVVIRARGTKYAALTRKGVEAIHEAAEGVTSRATKGAKPPQTVAGTKASKLLAEPEALTQLHHLSAKEKKKAHYNNPVASPTVADAVQLREGTANTTNQAPPLQAILSAVAEQAEGPDKKGDE